MFTLKQEPSHPSWVGLVFLIICFSFKSLVGGVFFVCLSVYLFICFYFLRHGLLCSPGCPRARCIDQNVLKLKETPTHPYSAGIKGLEHCISYII